MRNTIPSDHIGQKRTGYFIAALLSQKGKTYLSPILKTLNHDVSESVWTMPEDALHITLCEIIRPNTDTPLSEHLFSLHEEEYIHIPKGILSDKKYTNITFDTIEASENAIIIKGHDNGTFATVRKQLEENLILPPETKKPPTIIHISIARYTKETSLGDIQNSIRQIPIHFEEMVTEFHLIKVLTSPLLKYEILQTYPLIPNN